MHGGTNKVAMHCVVRMLAAVRDRGEPWADYLQEAGISPDALQRSGHVTTVQYARLLRVLIERRDDEALGFLSRRLKPGSFAITMRNARSAPTLGVAMRRTCKTLHLLQDDFELGLHESGGLGHFTLNFNHAKASKYTFLHELLLRVYWQLFVWLAGGKLPAVRFEFSYACPAAPGSYTNVFSGQIVFDCPVTGVWFERHYLSQPVRRDEAALRSYLANAQLYVIMPHQFDRTVSSRVEQYLRYGQPAWAGLQSTARALGMSPATLQRHLAEEKTSFQTIKDVSRRDHAVQRLMTTSVSIKELADEVGFSDVTTFQRAFKRWTGCTPTVYRRTIMASPRAAAPRSGTG